MIPRLHLVTDDAVLEQPGFIKTATAMLTELGDRLALHLRGHEHSSRRLYEITHELQPQAARAGALLVVNDRVDVALAANVSAVQLGARSLPAAHVRALDGALLIGYSAHSSAEAAGAERDGANFILAGNIYQTASHPAAPPAGLSLISECIRECSVPVLAIGGVDTARVPELRGAGAHGVAVIRAVWHAADPVQAASQFAKLLDA